MSLYLEWLFDRDFNGIVANQRVRLSRERIEKDHYVICQSAQTKSTPGAKIANIKLPVSNSNEVEYCLEVDGFANNNHSFLWVIDANKKRLIEEYITLPELVASSQRIDSTKAKFKIKGCYNDFAQVSIGVLFGGAQPNVNDIFFIKRMKLYESGAQPQKKKSDGVNITRIYDNINIEEVDPKRDNGTLMEEGEYALIKHEGSGDHGRLYVAYREPDFNNKMTLKYVCNITSKDNILTRSLFLEEDQIIPIYDDQWKAYADVKDKEVSKQFYKADGTTKKMDGVSKKDGKVYLYFDKEGYIRWMNSRKMKQTAGEEVSISVSQPLVNRLREVEIQDTKPEIKDLVEVIAPHIKQEINPEKEIKQTIMPEYRSSDSSILKKTLDDGTQSDDDGEEFTYRTKNRRYILGDKKVY
jgi:hypothetical protein